MSENQNPPADDARAKFLAALEKKKNKNSSFPGGGTSSGYPSIEKWETGVTRGPGNTLGGKREDKTKRGKGNMLGKAGEKWSSGRTFGKTGKYSA